MKNRNLILILALTVATVSFAQKSVNKLPSDILTNWMEFHCKLVRSAKGIPHVAYSRHFAYTSIAAYESIVAANPSYQSLVHQINDLDSLPVTGRVKLFQPASVNAAYAEMLRNFYGSFGTCGQRIDSMEEAQKKHFKQPRVSAKDIDESSVYGKAIAQAIIQWSGTDGSQSTKEYTPLKGEGLWTPADKAATPFWAEQRTLTKDLLKAYALKQPLYSKDTATRFYQMAREVYTISTRLTPEQKATAIYWDDAPNGKYMTVFGHWTSILCGLIKNQDRSLIEATEAYARMSIAMHEASILSWKGKYQFAVVRPVTYIQQNINREWTSLISTPPHPEFPAAHATLSNAAATALCTVFGKACSVEDNSYNDIGLGKRSYASLQDAAQEAGISRLYGGIHYRYSIDQGLDLGAAVASHVDKVIIFRK